MIYSFALVFDKEINQKVLDFQKEIIKSFPANEPWIISNPHATFIKFDSKNNFDENFLKILSEGKEIDIEFSGVKFLPSREDGCWIEISILKTKEIINLQEELLQEINGCKILSGIGEKFRPHITLVKTEKGNFILEKLDPSLLRKNKIKAKLVLGKPDSELGFKKV